MRTTSFLRAAFSFKGRMARRPFWLAYIVNSILLCGGIFLYSETTDPLDRGDTGLIPFLLFCIVLIINRCALISRRFHDTGRSFVMYFGICIFGGLCGLAPVIGFFAELACVIGIVIILCQDTNYDDETYGPAPQKSESLDTDETGEETDIPNVTSLNGIPLEKVEECLSEATDSKNE